MLHRRRSFALPAQSRPGGHPVQPRAHPRTPPATERGRAGARQPTDRATKPPPSHHQATARSHTEARQGTRHNGTPQHHQQGLRAHQGPTSTSCLMTAGFLFWWITCKYLKSAHFLQFLLFSKRLPAHEPGANIRISSDDSTQGNPSPAHRFANRPAIGGLHFDELPNPLECAAPNHTWKLAPRRHHLCHGPGRFHMHTIDRNFTR